MSLKPAVCLILTSVPDKDLGRLIARTLIEKRLAACVHLQPRGESCYWWEGRMETAEEHLLLIKTLESSFDEVSACISGLHAYELPEILLLPGLKGSKAYLDWVGTSVHDPEAS